MIFRCRVKKETLIPKLKMVISDNARSREGVCGRYVYSTHLPPQNPRTKTTKTLHIMYCIRVQYEYSKYTVQIYSTIEIEYVYLS
jgi:hypothetical protein